MTLSNRCRPLRPRGAAVRCGRVTGEGVAAVRAELGIRHTRDARRIAISRSPARPSVAWRRLADGSRAERGRRSPDDAGTPARAALGVLASIGLGERSREVVWRPGLQG